MNEEQKQKVATFRFSIIGEMVNSRLEAGELQRLIREKASRKWEIPFSTRTRISQSTIRRWIRAWRRSGGKLESLYPDDRNDRDKSRAIDNETAQNLIALRQQMPKAPVHVLIEEAVKKQLVSAGVRLYRTTVYRFLHRHGLMDQVAPALVDRRKFEAELPNDLWQSDVMHGPQVSHEGKLRKTYLIAFLDDHSRLITFGAFFLSEATTGYLQALQQAIAARGLPRKLYVDNGSAFRSHHLQLVCASLGIALIHAAPYTPQGKGKIERFFRTVRSGFLSQSTESCLADLNQAFQIWLRDKYHQTRHSATGQSPFERFSVNMQCLRLAPENLHDHFRTCARRRVAKDRSVSLNGRLYEAPVALIGQQIQLLYHPEQLDPVEAVFQNTSYGILAPVDTAVNARTKRLSGQLF